MCGERWYGINDMVDPDDIVHVVPVNDLREHSIDVDKPCWCSPDVDDDDEVMVIVVHHSMDGREAYEDTGRKMH